MSFQASGRKLAESWLTRLIPLAARLVALPVALLLTASWLGLTGADADTAAEQPDLGVSYVSITPRYPAYEVVTVEGIPLLLDPATREPLPLDGRDLVKRHPKRGEKVTATARVVNHGGADAGPFEYSWLLNGKKVHGGRHPGLGARCTATPDTRPWQLAGGDLREAVLKLGTVADFSYEFPFRGARQQVEFRVEPTGSGLAVDPRTNNSRLERVDALAFVALIRRGQYNRWAELAAAGQVSFEDWMQQQFAALRQKFEQSAYASAPGGVRQAIRLDTIRVLADDETAAVLTDAHAVNGWDGMVDYGPLRDPAADAPLVDWTLIRGLTRQLGVVDLEPLRVVPEANAVREAASGLAPIGFAPPPAMATEETLFGEHTVLALNRQVGSRRGYRGAYLYDVPRSCRVRVLDNNAGTVPDAGITVYQAEDGRVGEEPIARGTTNADGEWPLPNRPAPAVRTAIGSALRENPFGKIDLNGGNGLLLVRIAARGEVEYQWLPITLFNQAYWRGQTALATFDLRTRIPAPQAPAPPEEPRLQREGEDPEQIILSWAPSPAPDVAAYFIYRGSYPAFQWERVGAVTDRHQAYTDAILPPPGQRLRFRYAVTAVNLQGNESGLCRLPGEVVIK